MLLLFNTSYRWIRIIAAVAFSLLLNSPSMASMETAGTQSLVPGENNYALVLGVEHYEHWPARPNAISDARNIAWLLEKNGFRVVLSINPSASRFKAEIEDLIGKTISQDLQTIIFYYTGHGITTQSSDGVQTGWMVLRDCPQLDDNATDPVQKAVSISYLDRLAEKIPVQQVLLLFDTAVADDTLQYTEPLLRIPDATRGLPVRQYIFAGQWDTPKSARGPFVGSLIKGLTGEADMLRDDLITGPELGLYLAQMLKVRSGQRVKFAVPRNHEVTRGDIALKILQHPMQSARLYVDTQPSDTIVRIMNIRPKFHQGIDLAPGKYHISVAAQGYRSTTKWIELNGGGAHTQKIVLKKENMLTTNTLGLQLRRVKAGTYTMGSTDGKDIYADSEGAHTVELSREFYFQTTEVTVAQFAQFIKETGYRTSAEKTGCWLFSDQYGWQKNKQAHWRNNLQQAQATDEVEYMPVSCVSWQDAKAYADWLSRKEAKIYQLPTEAQWEYACRALTPTAYAYGICLTREQAHFDNTGPPFHDCAAGVALKPRTPSAVGRLRPNAWGLYDMHGNVAEWCSDWLGPYPDGRVSDPLGPQFGVEKVIRGGHFLSAASECRSTRRLGFPPGEASSAIGFRVVLLP